jgi:ABC-type multidrug transport system fused ATPase/permease subunit
MLLTTTPRLMLTVAGIVVLVVLPAAIIGRRVRKLSRASQDRLADTSGIAGEILNAIPVVQSYTQESAEARVFPPPTSRPSPPRSGAAARARRSPPSSSSASSAPCSTACTAASWRCLPARSAPAS